MMGGKARRPHVKKVIGVIGPSDMFNHLITVCQGCNKPRDPNSLFHDHDPRPLCKECKVWIAGNQEGFTSLTPFILSGFLQENRKALTE